MEQHPYAPFVRWARRYCTDRIYRNGGPAGSAQEWIDSFGVVAGRIHRYLELGHPGAQALPASLVLDIVELEESRYARFPIEDPRRALIETWSGLAWVYGIAGTPGDREFHRLDLLTDWAAAFEAAARTDFPGQSLLLHRFRQECRRLDLTCLRQEDHDFEYVGFLVELLKLYRTLLPTVASGNAPAHRQFPGKPNGQAVRVRRTQTGRQPAAASPNGTRAISPTYEAGSKRAMKERQTYAGHALYGNWSDHWRNTLPGRN